MVPKKVGGGGNQGRNRGVGLGLKEEDFYVNRREREQMGAGIGRVVNLLGRKYYGTMTSVFSKK